MIFALKSAAWLASLGSLFWVTGYLVETRFRQPENAAVGVQLVRVVIGAIAWIYLLFGFACAGWYRARVVLPIGCVVMLAGVCRAVLASRGTVVPWRWPWTLTAESWRGIAGGLCLSVLPALTLAAIFFQAHAPAIGWDDDVYHLTLPKLYLAHGGFRPVPFNVYSNWPHNVELLFGLAMMGGDYVLAKLIHAFFLLLLVLAVFRLCRQHTSRAAAVLASLLVLANPVVLFEAEYAYVDLAFAFFFLIAVSSAIDYLRSDNRSALLLSGLSCGALAGTKLSGFSGVLCVLVVVVASRPLQFGIERLRTIARTLLLPTLLLAIPWYAKSCLYTGNPFYPLLYPQLGGGEWSVGLGQQFVAWQRTIGMGRSLHDYVALPLRVVLDGGRGYDHFDGQVGKFWLVAVPLASIVAIRARPVRPYLASAAVYFAFWALSSQQMRFLIALLPSLAIATGMAVAWLDSQILLRWKRALFRAGVWVAAVATLLPILLPSWQRGLAEVRALIDHGPPQRSSVVPEGYAFINANTAPDAKIMLLNTNHGFFLDRAYIADSFFEASQMSFVLSQARSEEGLANVLEELMLTHLYVQHADMGVEYPGVLERFLSNPRRARLAFRCSDGGCSLYALQR